MFQELDPLLHSQLRLSVMSLLVAATEADFNYIKEKTGATSGNLSVQLSKLSEAGYIIITKEFRDNYPLTKCKITSQGLKAFQQYVEALGAYLKPGSAT